MVRKPCLGINVALDRYVGQFGLPGVRASAPPITNLTYCFLCIFYGEIGRSPNWSPIRFVMQGGKSLWVARDFVVTVRANRDCTVACGANLALRLGNGGQTSGDWTLNHQIPHSITARTNSYSGTRVRGFRYGGRNAAHGSGSKFRRLVDAADACRYGRRGPARWRKPQRRAVRAGRLRDAVGANR